MTQLDEIKFQNAESIKQCQSYLSALSNSELSTSMPAGWTVSSVLVHLIFWDQRALTLLEKWKKEGIEFSAIDTEVINEVTRPICLAVPPRTAVGLFFETAEKLNITIANLESAWVEEILEKGKNVILNRAIHRLKHLEEIKIVLNKH